MDRSGAAQRGLVAGGDRAGFRARHENPVAVGFEDWTVAKVGPWSQGPVFLQQLLMLNGSDLRAAGFLSADHIHLVTEYAKLAFADREAWYADPDFAEVPLAALLSPDYSATRRALVGDRASLELRPGAPAGRKPRLPRRSGQAGGGGHWTGAGRQAVGEGRRDTVHVAVADRRANMVACTPRGGWLTCSAVIAVLGSC